MSGIVNADDPVGRARMLVAYPLTQAQEMWLQGFTFAVTEYAVWHDGKQFVGVMERPLFAVIEEQRQRLCISNHDAHWAARP